MRVLRRPGGGGSGAPALRERREAPPTPRPAPRLSLGDSSSRPSSSSSSRASGRQASMSAPGAPPPPPAAPQEPPASPPPLLSVDVPGLATQLARSLALVLPVYVLGYLGLSFSWVLLALLCLFWAQRRRGGKSSRLGRALALLQDEERAVRLAVASADLPAWVSERGERGDVPAPATRPPPALPGEPPAAPLPPRPCAPLRVTPRWACRGAPRLAPSSVRLPRSSWQVLPGEPPPSRGIPPLLLPGLAPA